jgi:hypothetical protein
MNLDAIFIRGGWMTIHDGVAAWHPWLSESNRLAEKYAELLRRVLNEPEIL